MGNMKFKVGDRVRIKSLDWYNENKDKNGHVECGTVPFDVNMQIYCGSITTIYAADEIGYDLDVDWGQNVWTDEMIEGLVEEEEIEFTEEDKYRCDIMSESDPTTYVLPEGYQFVDENGNVINATKIVLEKKKKEYPKTFLGCCDVLGIEDIISRGVNGYRSELLDAFQKLLICRDAYWKLYGKEMGLGKPWEPDWMNDEQFKYVIICRRNCVIKDTFTAKDVILSFPTEEMRDAFYENFKELIESCKELL